MIALSKSIRTNDFFEIRTNAASPSKPSWLEYIPGPCNRETVIQQTDKSKPYTIDLLRNVLSPYTHTSYQSMQFSCQKVDMSSCH